MTIIREKNHVTEIQGMYGPLQILESKIQQIWAFQHLQSGGWMTRSGRRLRVVNPGHWNRGAGPDFKEATIALDDQVRMGDVEIHLYREDWWRHGHDLDPGYSEVILHVVLFAGGLDRRIINARGEAVDEWNMGPWMREDVESVSGGSPGLFGELVPELKEWVESDDPVNIRERLRIGSDKRWQDKVSMARCLLETYGWQGGLHRMCLYYLGFPYNRRPFYEMAEAFPMECWRAREILAIIQQRWSETVRWRYGRPANRADRRILQYIQLNQHVPDWCLQLENPPDALLNRLRSKLANSPDKGTAVYRREIAMANWNRWIEHCVLGKQLNTSLAQRLWVDVFLPLLSAAEVISLEQGMGIWFHSRPATFPESYRELLRLASVHADKAYPLCNGWVQGLYWLEDQLRLERVRTALGQQTLPLDGSGA